MEKHIKVVGWMHALWAPTLIGLALLLGFVTNDEKAAVIGLLLPMFFLVLGPEIYSGVGLLRHSRLARRVLVVYSSMLLLVIPVGTVAGIYSLWVLLHQETRNIFFQAN